MTVYRVDVTFTEQAGAYIEVLANSEEEASKAVLDMLIDSNVQNPKIISVSYVRSDEEHAEVIKSLN